MICPCGALMGKRFAETNQAFLTWTECGKCGRAGKFSLYVGGVRVDVEQAERLAFQDECLIQRIFARLTHQA